ncbi:hypothetical protein LCGC14_3087920 [marine sediment metagenome]|uniref:Uncharacterized protein n=1 Tax=marine sediment metagenome TaxID=412755 RepID=A0A0F8X015_9ZZZZ
MDQDTQKFIDLRARIIKEQGILNKIGLPKTNFSKTELRTGLMGRAQRKENVRFLKKIKAKKIDLARKRTIIERYLQRVEAIPAPKIMIGSRPILRKVRGTRMKTQIRRRRKR